MENKANKVKVETYKKAILEIVIKIEEPEELEKIYNYIFRNMKRAGK